MIKSIYTAQTRNSAVRTLTNFIDKLYRKRKKRTTRNFLADLPIYLNRPLKKQLDPTQKMLPEKLAEDLEKKKKNLINLPTAKITLAYHPSQDQVQELAKILRKKFNQNLILETEFSTSVCPNCQIEFKGRRYHLEQ